MEQEQVQVQDQEKKVSEKLLDELEVIELLASELQGSFKQMRQIILANGDPEQNVRDNAMQLRSFASTGGDFFVEEISNSLRSISDALEDVKLAYLGIEANENDRFRHLVSTNK